MGRRISFFVLGFVLMLAAGAMLIRPTGVLADTTFPDCPTLSDLQAAVTAGGTITFGTANCTLTVDTSILVGDNTTVTINGNRLTLNGTDDVTVLKFSPTGTNLTLVDTTIKGGNGGIVCELTSLGCFTATTNTSQVTLTNSSVNSGVGFPYNLSLTDSTVSGPGIVAEGPVTLTRSTVKSGGLMTMGLGDDPIMLTGSTVKGGAFAVSNQGAGSITVTDSTATGGLGGGISGNGKITLTGSSVTGNDVGIYGGGAVSITSSTVSGNGKIGVSAAGSITVINSSVSDNGESGIAGINGAPVYVADSTVSGNGSFGVFANNGRATLINSTFSGNHSDGVFMSGGTVEFSTFVNNGEYGISVYEGDISLTGVLLSANGQMNCSLFTPTKIDGGSNFSTDDSCSFSADTSRNNVPVADLHLGSLGDYGGPTKTIPLLSGSVALGAVPAGQGACLDKDGNPIVMPGSEVAEPIQADQRGVTRPQGANCDPGAYEAAAMTTSTDVNPATANYTDSTAELSAAIILSDCPTPTTTCSDSVLNQGIVTFTVTDGNGTTIGTSMQSGPVTDGLATATFDTSSLMPGSYTITAAYHDASGLYGDSQNTGTLTILGPPASIGFSPGSTSATAGTTVTETATVHDINGNLVADGTPITFVVTGSGAGSANPANLTTTTTNGQATFGYTNTMVTSDEITATAGTDPQTASASITVSWLPGPPASLTIDPSNSVNGVDQTVTLTATVRDEFGNLVADNTTVDFDVSGVNELTGSSPTQHGQAIFSYSSIFPGTDTVVATAEGGTNPSDSATVVWATPTSTNRASLTIINPLGTQISALVQVDRRGHPTGSFQYSSRALSLNHVQLTSLVVSGSQATLYGTAQLSDGSTVTFRLDATERLRSGSVRLRLNNGYDSGSIHVAALRVTP